MMAASLVVKVIGAFFQIPLQNLIGGEKSPAFGMFSAAYRIYTAMLVVSTVGLPAALSKMVAEATARGREHEVRRIVRVAAGIFVPVGALCSLALFFGAGTFAAWIKSEDSRLAVMAIAPSVLMVAVLSVFRGYYQGRSNMVPTAVSQVIEAAGKLFIGLGLACWAVGRGFDDPVVAALTVLGVTIGEVVAAAYMLVQAALSRGETRVRALDPAVRPTLTLAKTLLSLSIPITISSSVMSITDLIDVALISSRLQSPAVHMAADEAMQTYGIYTGVINFFNLPQTLITALAVSVLPTIASARAAGNETGANRTLSTTLRMTLMLTLPAGAGFFLLGGPILRIFLSSGTVLGGQLMSILGFAVPAVALVAVTNAVLQAYSRIDLPLHVPRRGGQAVRRLFHDRRPALFHRRRTHQHGAVLLADRPAQPVPYRAVVARSAAGRPDARASSGGDGWHGCGGRHRKDARAPCGSCSGQRTRQVRDSCDHRGGGARLRRAAARAPRHRAGGCAAAAARRKNCRYFTFEVRKHENG